ncbi:hypothetical protein ACOSQ2_030484 [Xanthoceras sorbifolium]
MFPSVKLLGVLSGMRSELQRVCQEADKILDNIINEHIACKATIGEGEEKDLVHVLLNLQDRGDLEIPLTTDNIKAVIQNYKGLHQKADKILDNIINEHIACKAMGTIGEGEEKDLVHVLLNLQDQGDLEIPLTTDNIKAVILDLFMAGTETSSATLEWAVAEMLKNPKVLEKAQAEVRQVFDRKGYVDEAGFHELEYLKLVIKETFRLHPPVPLLLPRECRESCKIDGYDILVRSKVIVNTWAIGRDPNYWMEPESFFPERFLDSSINYKGASFELIPFGAGRRMCPGLTFGIANIELALANFLYHFDWKLPNGVKNEDLDMTENFGAVVKRKNDLYLISIPYHPPRS